MRALQVFGVVCGALAIFPRAACAVTITAHATALVTGTSTVDTYGLFGPAGANLAGDAIDIKVSYDSTQYGAPTSCGNGCLSYATVVGPTRRAAMVKVTIGGVALVYKSTASGQVQFFNNGPGQHSFGIASNGDLTSMTGTGAGILIWCYHATKFGYPVIRKDHGTDRPQDYFLAFSAMNGMPEEITFSVQ